MKLECGFFFPEQDLKLPLIELHLADVRVREASLPGPLSARLEIRTALPVDPQRFAQARRVRKSSETIRRDLEELASAWFRSACTLEDFCFARDKVQGTLEKVVRTYVEEKLLMDFESLTANCEVPFPKEVKSSLQAS